MSIKAILAPGDSIVASIATIALVYAIYEMNLGSTASVHATDAYHPILSASVKKAGWESVAFVGAVGLLARDPNIIILGGAAIIAADVHYKHAIASDGDTGQMLPPTPDSYLTPDTIAGAEIGAAALYSGV